MKKISYPIVLITAVFSFLSFNAYSYPITFFGEDANRSGGYHATSWINSSAAQTNFLNSLNTTNIHIEDFQGYADATPGAGLAVDFGEAGIARLNGGYVSGDWDTAGTLNPVTNGRFSTDTNGDHFLEVPTSTLDQGGIGSFTLEFEKAQSAFGFFGTDFENSDVQLSLTFENALGGILTLDIPHNQTIRTGSVLFFGVIDNENSFTKVTFTGENVKRDWFGFDDFTIATKEQIIPETATFIFLGFGIAGLLAFRRKKKIA